MTKACTTQAQSTEVLERIPFFPPAGGESVAIIGVSQNGKTWLAMQWAASLAAAGTRVVAWDACWQFAKDAKLRARTKPGPLDRTVTVSELEDAPELLLGQRLNLAVRPEDIWASREEIAEEFIRFARLLVASSVGAPVALFIDEVNLLMEHRKAASLLDDISERWGKEELIPFFITQRWSHFSPSVRAEFAWVVSFHQNKPSDLQFLSNDVGSAFARAVGQLQPFEYRARRVRHALPETLAALG